MRRNTDTAYDLVQTIRSVMRAAQPPTALILDSETHLDEVMRFFEMESVKLPESLYVMVVQLSNPDRCAHKNRIGYYQFDFLRIGQMVGSRILDLIAGKHSEPLHQEVVFGRIVDPSPVRQIPSPLISGGISKGLPEDKA